MSQATHPDLDLVGTIRPGLDILANEIVIALKKRTRFKHNPAVYQPGLVVPSPTVSLLDYELHTQERTHAELGRYSFASQDSFTDVSDVKPVIQREIPASPVQTLQSDVGAKILAFYQQWIAKACGSGENPATYGETVTTDVIALLAIMERINLGRAVAESKFLEVPEKFIETKGDRESMLQYIVRSDREQQVIQIAENLADNYDLSPEHTVEVFKFMIATTVDLEVEYLKRRIAEFK